MLVRHAATTKIEPTFSLIGGQPPTSLQQRLASAFKTIKKEADKFHDPSPRMLIPHHSLEMLQQDIQEPVEQAPILNCVQNLVNATMVLPPLIPL